VQKTILLKMAKFRKEHPVQVKMTMHYALMLHQLDHLDSKK
jgi:hypothetical protein